MAVVLSTDLEEVKVQARGNWFTFQPGKIKVMDDNLAHFLCTDRAYMGFVALPEICADDPSNPEAVKAKEEAFTRGRQNLINFHRRNIANLEVGLQRDLDMAGIKVDALKYVISQGTAAGVKKSYSSLAALEAQQAKDEDKELEEIKKLKEQISG